MKVILQFLKPHRKLCIVTILLSLVDIVGALIIPTYAAQMLNISTLEGTAFNTLLMICVKMLAAAVISGISMILSSYLCADLTSKVAADMRNALYKKTIRLSGTDFRSFGTASVTTRTVSDITNIQFAFGNCFQMLFPVPFIFIASLVFAFRIDLLLGPILLAVLITIARVFLCDPPVIILDEATSSVDTRTEMEISRAMKKLMKGRTSFVIAHRLSTIRDSDMILFMENGNIIEQGNHKQLLEKKGAYSALYYSQFA